MMFGGKLPDELGDMFKKMMMSQNLPQRNKKPDMTVEDFSFDCNMMANEFMEGIIKFIAEGIKLQRKELNDDYETMKDYEREFYNKKVLVEEQNLSDYIDVLEYRKNHSEHDPFKLPIEELLRIYGDNVQDPSLLFENSVKLIEAAKLMAENAHLVFFNRDDQKLVHTNYNTVLMNAKHMMQLMEYEESMSKKY